MINTFYNLFLHTNAWLMYKVNTVPLLNNFLTTFLKSCVMSDKSKSLKNGHTLLIYVIKKIVIIIFYNIFLHTNLWLMYKLNTVKNLNNLFDNIFWILCHADNG